MNSNATFKSVILLSSVLVSVLAFGLFYNHVSQSLTEQAVSHSMNGPAAPDTNSIPKALTKDSVYKAIIAAADKYFLEKDYTRCLRELEKAQVITPKEQSVKDRITKVKGLVEESKRKGEESRKAVASGDTYFSAKDYLNAKAAYQMAVGLTPDDAAVRDKLNKTLSLLRSQKASNTLYDVAVAGADKLFQEKQYDKARQEYENASKVLPGDTYAKNKINEIIKIQVDLQVKEESFARSIAAGDKFFTAKSYAAALAEYKNAATLKPTEKYPQDRIKELTTLLAAQKARDDAYNKAIAAADQLFTDTRYPESMKGYQDALVIKPEELYPKSRIKEIEGVLARAKKATEDYDHYVNLADSLYIGKNYLKARENYLNAASVKPKESYPKEMLSKAEKMLTGQEAAMAKAMEEQYAASIASADKLLASQSYEAARAEYDKAANMKPLEQYPKDKIAAIDRLLTDQKVIDDQYKSSLARGDKLFTQKSWEPARTEYQKAAGLKPSEKYATEKIAAIDLILNELTSKKNLEEQYKSLIASADQKLTGKSYEEARTDYEKARTLKPAEFYPKSKLAEIERILQGVAAQRSAEERYLGTIRRGDSLLVLKAYTPALSEFQNALKIKPAEVYPKTKTAEISQVLADLAKQKRLEDQYAASIKKADGLFTSQSYALARDEFSKASGLKPAESYPKDRLAAIEKILADVAAQKALDEQYKTGIAAADKLMLAKSLTEARTAYVNAGNLKPAEQYPRDKIAEIDRSMGELAARKALDEQYTQTIAAADKLLADKGYDKARQAYQNAAALKPAEAYPKTKIAEIDKALQAIAEQKALEDRYAGNIRKGDSLLALKAYEPALGEFQQALKIKPDEVYPKTKTTEISQVLADFSKQKALDDSYAASIKKADALFTSQSYPLAKDEYNKALGLKPGESYPKEKIAAIEKILADVAAKKALDEKYNGVIASADKLMLAKSLDEARAAYENAGSLKPGESYPKTKIAEIDKTLGEIAAKKTLDEKYKAAIDKADQLMVAKSWDQAKTEYTQALTLKREENYPKLKIGQIDSALAVIARKKALDEEYAATLSDGDKLLAAKSFEEARTAYQKALSLKPSEQYPKLKLAEAEKGVAELARKKALDDQYAAAVATADRFLGEKSYDSARLTYQNAGRLKPAEQYPKDKIAEIGTLLAGIAKQKALDDQYRGAIGRADKLLEAMNYPQARLEYQNALKLKQEEQYPKDKVGAIDAILAEIKAKDDEYKAVVTKADQLLADKKYDAARTEYQNAGVVKPEVSYPKDKIAEINKILTELKGKKQTFDDLVVNGDEQLKQKEWARAKDLYQQALVIFPEETKPHERINFINAKMDSLYRANKTRYDKAVADGDRFYNTFEFDKAVDAFTEAITLLPMENYPKEMIAKIRRTISENAIVDVLQSTVTITAGNEKQFSFTPVNMASRKDNFVYIKIRNLSNKPFNVLMRYGKDKQANGGVVIRNLNLDGKMNERLVSVRDQDLWYRDDNNWISLYPQGGDIEVSFIQVSRAK